MCSSHANVWRDLERVRGIDAVRGFGLTLLQVKKRARRTISRCGLVHSQKERNLFRVTQDVSGSSRDDLRCFTRFRRADSRCIHNRLCLCGVDRARLWNLI